MARFSCKCGEILSNSSAPNEIQLKIFTDREWDNIINIGMVDSVDLPDPSYDVWKCPKCERVFVFGDNGKVKKTYIIEK